MYRTAKLTKDGHESLRCLPATAELLVSFIRAIEMKLDLPAIF